MIDDYKHHAQRILNELAIFTSILNETLIQLYGLQSAILKCVLKREQLENFIKAYVLSGASYVLIYNVLTLSQSDQIEKLEKVFI